MCELIFCIHCPCCRSNERYFCKPTTPGSIPLKRNIRYPMYVTRRYYRISSIPGQVLIAQRQLQRHLLCATDALLDTDELLHRSGEPIDPKKPSTANLGSFRVIRDIVLLQSTVPTHAYRRRRNRFMRRVIPI